MQIKLNGPMVLALTTTMVMLLSTGCASTPPSPADRLQARSHDAENVIDDPQRAAEAQAAFEGMFDAATELEASVAATRADLLAMHHDSTTTPEAFLAAIEATRRRHEPTLLQLVDQRLKAAASTTEREWKRLLSD